MVNVNGLVAQILSPCFERLVSQEPRRYRAFPGADCVAKSGGDVALLPENNLIEQDHRFIKRRVNPSLGFFSFNTARRTISGHETMNIISKGQVEGIGKVDIQGQVRFVSTLFMIAAQVGVRIRPFMSLLIFCNTTKRLISGGLTPDDCGAPLG
jgi:DDE domain